MQNILSIQTKCSCKTSQLTVQILELFEGARTSFTVYFSLTCNSLHNDDEFDAIGLVQRSPSLLMVVSMSKIPS